MRNSVFFNIIYISAADIKTVMCGYDGLSCGGVGWGAEI